MNRMKNLDFVKSLGMKLVWVLMCSVVIACLNVDLVEPVRSLEGEWVVDSFYKDLAINHKNPSHHHLLPGAEFELVKEGTKYKVINLNDQVWPGNYWEKINFEVFGTGNLDTVNNYLTHLKRQPPLSCKGQCLVGTLLAEPSTAFVDHNQVHVIVLEDVSDLEYRNPCDKNDGDRCLRIEIFCVPKDGESCNGDFETLKNLDPDLNPPPLSASMEPIHGGLGHSHGND